MPEIKRIFNEKYGSCDIQQIPNYEVGKYRLEGISQPNVYSVDHLFSKHGKIGGDRCDEFVFFELSHSSTGIYLIERKANSQNVEKVRRQLEGGAGFIEDFLNNDPATDGEPLDFMPVWVSNGLKSSTRQRLRAARVSLCNRRKPIKHVEDNKTLPITKQPRPPIP